MARIMIADDNPSVRFLISILVAKAGHEVVLQANNGLEVLNTFTKVNPDLLIVDYHMPMMDGISLIKEILKVDPDLKFLMCTGSFEELQCDARVNMDILVITKPFDNDEFIDFVSAALAN